ncbi:MAG: hypothetical protein RL091_1838 [Verrucomicrobiota bacterium]|jgi:hypothetical protein
MVRLLIRWLLPACCLLAPLFGEADWSRLKLGLTQEQTTEALGKPLIRTYGRGFEVWIYDSHGEVLFAGGPATGWTRPVPNPESASRPVERDVLIKPLVRLPPLRSLDPTQGAAPANSEVRFRYSRQR